MPVRGRHDPCERADACHATLARTSPWRRDLSPVSESTRRTPSPPWAASTAPFYIQIATTPSETLGASTGSVASTPRVGDVVHREGAMEDSSRHRQEAEVLFETARSSLAQAPTLARHVSAASFRCDFSGTYRRNRACRFGGRHAIGQRRWLAFLAAIALDQMGLLRQLYVAILSMYRDSRKACFRLAFGVFVVPLRAICDVLPVEFGPLIGRTPRYRINRAGNARDPQRQQ